MAAIENSKFYDADLAPDGAKAIEVLSGGFIQVQEYAVDNKTKVNYAVNVWGPVQCPFNYISKLQVAENQGKQFTQEQRDTLGDKNRQMTFTFRGRQDVLSQTPDLVKENKIFRWHSWYDAEGSGKKTSLLKFSWSPKAQTSSAISAEISPQQGHIGDIVVESWAMEDPDGKVEQQFTKYEK